MKTKCKPNRPPANGRGTEEGEIREICDLLITNWEDLQFGLSTLPNDEIIEFTEYFNSVCYE